jgi:predicted amidophosphoribosyltransferase
VIGDENVIPDIRKKMMSYNKKIAEMCDYTISKIISKGKEKILCGVCGKKNENNVKFCKYCGNKLK